LNIIKFNDFNKDGRMDSNEPGLEGFKFVIKDGISGVEYDTVTTDRYGKANYTIPDVYSVPQPLNVTELPRNDMTYTATTDTTQTVYLKGVVTNLLFGNYIEGSAPAQLPELPGFPELQQPSGCLIATAAFGSELTPQVQYLRNFRDNYILSTASGSAFMNTFNSIYYSFSPQVADYERDQPWLQATVKAGLYPLFGILTAAERSYSISGGELGSVAAGATASTLIGAVYLWPAGIAAKRVGYRSLAVIMGASVAALAITLIGLPVLLPITTAAFVVVMAGTSAIIVAKAIRHVVKSQMKRW
jgi:peptide/nickel transport system substrate-binding protein